mmetsp:Transcript_49733/g.112897  ORF Transcript_49733/g.112897 Transcript_49733/m.112897 type:complete len:118 (+) Transcript_49733:386-739(+)
MIPHFAAFAASQWARWETTSSYAIWAAIGNFVTTCCRLVGTVQEERYMHTNGNVPPEMASHRIDIVMDDGYNRSPTLCNMADVTFTHPVSTNQAKLTRYSRIDGAAAQEAAARKMRK